MEELVPFTGMIALALIMLAPFIIGLVAIIKWAENNHFRTQKQAEVLSQVIEKGTTDGLDISAIASAFNQQQSIKQSLLKNLLSGFITSLLGVGMLALGIVGSVSPDACMYVDASTFYMAAVILLSCGIALIAYYFIARKNLRAEIEKEEQNAQKDK